MPLSLTVMTGFGVILYGFSVYATDAAAGGEFSKTALSVAYGGAVFVGGLCAIPVGRFADRHGVRSIVAVGAAMAAAGLIAFALATESWHVIAAWWILIGPAQAMVYYEPAYVAIDQWSEPADRARTLGTITVIGGLAGIIFIPLTARLVEWLGWRPAVVLLGIAMLIVGEATALWALPHRHHQNDMARAAGPNSDRTASLLRDGKFVLYTAALMLILLATQGVIAHRLARFEEAGRSLAIVALWAAIASALSLPGRWIAPRMAERLGPTRLQAVIALVVAASVVLMVDGSSSWHLAGHFLLFGLSFGALLPLRAMVMGAWYSGPTFGRIMGTQWTSVVLVAAMGPVLVGVLRDATGTYLVSFAVLTMLFVLAAGLIYASGRAESPSSRIEGATSR